MYNINKMKRVGQKTKPAFTIIETVMYLALTGVLFVTAIATTRNVMTRQRYQDALQGVLSELREAYDEVAHPEIINTGNCFGTFGSVQEGYAEPDSSFNRGQSNCVIYGKVLSIYYDSDAKNSVIEKAPVVGMDVSDQAVLDHIQARYPGVKLSEKSTLEALQYLGADVMVAKGRSSGQYTYGAPDLVDSYRTHNKTALYLSQAKMWKTMPAYKSKDPSSGAETNVSSWFGYASTNQALATPASLTILIVRSPITGQIETFAVDDFLGEDIYNTLENHGDTTGSQWHYSVYARLQPAVWWRDRVNADPRFVYQAMNRSDLNNVKFNRPSSFYFGLFTEVTTGQIFTSASKKHAALTAVDVYLCLESEQGAHSSTERARMIRIKKNASSSNDVVLLSPRDSATYCEKRAR